MADDPGGGPSAAFGSRFDSLVETEIDPDYGWDKQTGKKKKAKRTAQRDSINENWFTKQPKLDNNGPRFLVLHRNHPTETMKEVSPFLIKKAIDSITPNVTISRMKEGDLLLKTQSKQQAEKLIKQNMLGGIIPVMIKEHATLNQTRGTISCFDLKALTDQEILEGLKESSVIAIERVKRRNRDGDLVDSSIFILTFALGILPNSIDVGFHRCKVQLYVPTPMRCMSCLRYGHKKTKCRDKKMCANCSAPSHEQECNQPTSCINCNGRHNALSRDCPVYQDEYEIQRICATEKISLREARQKRRSQIPNPINRRLTSSFAAVVRAQPYQQQLETDEPQQLQTECRAITSPRTRATPSTPTDEPQQRKFETRTNKSTSTPESPTTPSTTPNEFAESSAPSGVPEEIMSNADGAKHDDYSTHDPKSLTPYQECGGTGNTNTNESNQMNQEIDIENFHSESTLGQEFSQLSQAIRSSLFVNNEL